MELPSLNFFHQSSSFSHRLLGWSDREQVLAFRRDIFIDIAPHFRVLDPQVDDGVTHELMWCEKHLLSPGVTLGVFDEHRLIAYASILLSVEQGATQVAQLLRMNEFDLLRSADLSSCMVHKQYRGLRLQASLLRWRIELATKQGRSLFVGMTACGNSYSLRNMLEARMTIRWIGQIAPDRWFLGLMLDTQSDSQEFQVDALLVDSQDFSKQMELLACGYEGISIEFAEDAPSAEVYQLRFSKRQASDT